MVTNSDTEALLENSEEETRAAQRAASHGEDFITKSHGCVPTCYAMVGPRVRVNIGLINAHGRATRPILPPMAAYSSPPRGDPSGPQTPELYPWQLPATRYSSAGGKSHKVPLGQQ